MENLAANTVLREVTNKPEAMIATVTMPFKYDEVETDFFPLVLMPTFAFFV